METTAKIPARNAQCPCGSGRKFKHCCQRRAPAPVPPASRVAEAEACVQCGDLAGASRRYEALLLQAPRDVAVLQGAALQRYRMGDRSGAINLLRRACELYPEEADPLTLLGAMVLEDRQVPEAIVCLHRAIRLRPDHADAHNNLAYALLLHGKWPEAEHCCREALRLRPGSPAALCNLGLIFRAAGRPTDALACFEEVLAQDERNDRAWNNMAIVLQESGRWEDAARSYARAAALVPGSAVVHYNLGIAFQHIHSIEAAVECFERAVSLDPALAEAHLNIGNARKDQGRLAEALACYSRALAVRPDYHGAHSNMLFTTAFMDDLTQAQIFELHCGWARLQAAALPPPAPHANRRDPGKRLKIAYVSPDFRRHACAAFLEPLLRHHDRDVVEVHAFAEVAEPDAMTAELRGLVDAWHDTVGLPDEALDALIRAEGIDMVIDLAGHTAHNRLLALARQPAPVQLTYLGYPATTGLSAMAWRLTDGVTEPPGASDPFYTERLYRLPHSLWCYQPLADMPAVSPLPALGAGQITFGSFNGFAKVGPRVLALWAKVLHAVPDSRLVMITVPAGQTQAAVWASFEATGITRERVILLGRLSREDYLKVFAQVDIALDPFPCNGGTTTCDALWMGLPVVALAGGTFLSRASLSVLTAGTCPEFAARDEDDYIARCKSLAADPAALAGIREGLRERLANSPLMDAAGFTRDVEAAYRQMWRDWCASRVVA